MRCPRQGCSSGPLTKAAGGEEMLGAVSDGASDYFTVLNDAFTRAPLVVDVPAGAALDGTIVVRHHAGEAGAASFPRLVVRVGRGAQATVLDVQQSAGPALVVPVVELDVGPAARLGYLNLQQHDQRAWQIAAHTARVDRDATLVVASVAFGGAYARTRTDIRLVGRGGQRRPAVGLLRLRPIRSSTSGPIRTTPRPTRPRTCSTRAPWATRPAACTPG